MNDFIELKDLRGQYALNELRKNHKRNLVQDTFEIGTAQKILDQCNQKTITRGICVINMIIRFTAWPVINPIIMKISNSIDRDILGRKINCIKMRFM